MGATVLVMGCGASPNSAPPAGAPGVAQSPGVTGVSAGLDADGAAQPLRLDDMDLQPTDPTPEQRNPFRFGATRSAASVETPPFLPAPVPRLGDVGRDDELVIGPSSGVPQPLSAIPLTFIGFMESPGIEGRVVVLTDGDDVFYGRRGEVIDGRYRILSLGLQSVELERIDGGGRATLRLPNDVSGGI